MKIHLIWFLLLPLLGLSLASCGEKEEEWDPYYNWQGRNAQWFADVTDSARTAIAQAQAQYGDAWEDHCEWRRYKTLLKDQGRNTGLPTDSICVRIVKRGDSTSPSPVWSDTVRLSFRGWLMPTTYKLYNAQNQEVDSLRQEVFSQTYYGTFDEATAAPQKASIPSTVEGFSTALQYMHVGDDWYVYMPQQMGYGSTATGSIPAYSTLLFRIHLAAVYPAGTTIPSWK